MKAINKVLTLCILLTCSFTSHAQISASLKPGLFDRVASSLTAAIPELDKAFIAKQGTTIQLNFSNNFIFNGIILSSVQRYDKLKSIIIKSSLLHNTLLALSKRINDD
ncbi:MAG: hypothetical protein ABJA71_11280, partial [Ginsengibacter sp.]